MLHPQTSPHNFNRKERQNEGSSAQQSHSGSFWTEIHPVIIERLDLKAFGRFTDVSLDLSAGPRRFHVIYGPNESGKSTSLRAVSSLLFGFPHQAEDSYLHASTQLRIGARLTDHSGTVVECVRRRGRKATLRDAQDDQVLDDTEISKMLGGIDRETFQSRFGLSHQELVRGGAQILSGEGDLGKILFAAGAGVSQLRELQDQLDAVAGQLFSPRGTKPSINVSLRVLDEQRKELRQTQLAPAEYAGRRNRLEEKREESKQLQQHVQECVVELARKRAFKKAIPLAPIWRSTREALSKLANVPALDEAFTERRRQAVSDLQVALSRQSELETQLHGLETRWEGLPADPDVMDHEAEVQALFQQIAAHEKAELDKQSLRQLARKNQRRIVKLLDELSVSVDQSDPEALQDDIDDALSRIRVSESMRVEIRELASQYSSLIAQRNDASDRLETEKRRLADLSQELDGLDTPVDPTSLAAAIDAVGNPQALKESVIQQQATCQGLQRRCDSLLTRLEGFSGTLREVIELRLPDESDREVLSAKLQQSQQKIVIAQEHTEQLRREREELQLQLQVEDSSQSLPTLQQLEAAREQRNLLIDHLSELAARGQRIDEAIVELRQHVHEADAIVDTIRMHHEQVHQRQVLINRLDVLEKRIGEAGKREKQTQSDADKLQSQWLALWNECDVAAGSPARMERWLADREQLCEFFASLCEEQSRLEQSQQRTHRAAQRLGQAVVAAGSKQFAVAGTSTQGGLFDDPTDDDLVALFEEAVVLRDRCTLARTHYENLVRRRDELAEELPVAEARLEACQAKVEQWHRAWRRSTASFVETDRASTQEVLQMLDQIQKLEQQARDREAHAEQTDSIERDRAAFATRVKNVADSIKETYSQSDAPESIARGMYRRLQTEREAIRSRGALQEQIQSTKRTLMEVGRQRQSCEAVLQQLCLEAGCDQPDMLPQIERSARDRSALQAELRDLENQLTLLAGDTPVDEFVESAANMQPSLLIIEIEQQEEQLRKLRESAVNTEQEVGALQHEIAKMDGSARASELMQTIQLTAGQISRDAEIYARAKIASLILQLSIDHYRKENQSPVLAHAQHFFSVLTCGEYHGLKVDFDAKGNHVLFGVRSDGSPEVPANAMSTGTADALYLALRLASLRHQIRHSCAVPLVIDDCLIQLDDRRASAAMHALSELSEQTQVILFTHHRHLLQLAKQSLGANEYHVHELGV